MHRLSKSSNEECFQLISTVDFPQYQLKQLHSSDWVSCYITSKVIVIDDIMFDSDSDYSPILWNEMKQTDELSQEQGAGKWDVSSLTQTEGMLAVGCPNSDEEGCYLMV